MAKPLIADSDFVRLFNELGPSKLAERIGTTKRAVFFRRRTIEEKLGSALVGPPNWRNTRVAGDPHEARLHFELQNGVMLVGSDAHIWPGDPSTGMRAFLKFVKELQPNIIVLNGDVLDFPQISRHPPIGHQYLPDVQDEIECAQEQLHELEKASKRSTKLVWSLGNHDARFETRLATIAPEFARLHGHSLKNYFPAWQPCWSTWVNNSVVIKHRFKGGIHAPHNNTMWAGKTMVTGHLHSAKVTPYTDFNGTRYGVDTGCLADPSGQQFLDYTEDNPKSWISGFGVFTFYKGKLLFPELVTVFEKDIVQFRGKLIKI